jgi:riboflavin synthase
MFTGLVSDIGQVVEVQQLNEGKRFKIKTTYDPKTIEIGASIACNGVCQTVVALGEDCFEVEAWEEALRLTNMQFWNSGEKINLERSLKMGDELGGHLVSGHVDGMAKLLTIKDEGDAKRFILEVDEEFSKFIAPKGSVALNGTSLTVNGVEGMKFDVLLIQHTQEVTNWHLAGEGDLINFEIDTMARYAARLLEFR